MKCRYCNSPEGVLAIIPEGTKNAKINKSAFAHIGCLRKRHMYCDQHSLVHMSVEHGNACVACVAETVASLLPHAEAIVAKLREALPEEKMTEMEEWAMTSSGILRRSLRESIMYAVATSFHVLRSQERDPDYIEDLSYNSFDKHLHFVVNALNQTF